MTGQAKQVSNPYLSGEGGAVFENRVQAAFAVLMLTGRVAPYLHGQITKLKLQGRYAGFNTDDFIVFTEDGLTGRKEKLLAQIKHSIRITERNETFGEVIQAAWNDYNNPELFSPDTDSIALITGPLTAAEVHDVRPLLEWARHSEDENEFLLKVNMPNFSSETKRSKLKAFRKHLQNANGGIDLTDHQIWEFLKHFYLLSYDLDTESGITLSLIQSLIAQSSTEDPVATWKSLVVEVQTFNPDAGTLSLETISEEIRNSFDTKNNPHWVSDIKKLQDHGKYIIDGIRSDIGGVTIERRDLFKRLIDVSERTEFVFISGERGCGKSSLVRAFAKYIEVKAPIFCLRTEDLDKPHLDNVLSAIGLTSSLRDIEAGFALMPKRYLLIESLEKLLELQNTAAFKDLLLFVKSHPGWTIIASGRDYAYQEISFNYLQPCGVPETLLVVSEFSDDEVQDLCEKLEPLRSFVTNPSLKPLLKNPFFADLAYRIALTGTAFSNEDGEREFRRAVWRDVISKKSIRTEGLPLRRKRTFIDISVKRAKRMVYGVPEREFDSSALQKLEEDNLIRQDPSSGLVSPSHDVLEDWALERYIEDAFQDASGNTYDFLDAVGHEPAMSRAFRQWLHQRLKYGEDVKPLILDILHDNSVIERCWQDETITAVLLGDNPQGFLEELSDQLFANDSELLKRFCFILRISCKVPNQDLIDQLSEENARVSGILSSQLLRPYGRGWESIIRFLFERKNLISGDLLPHISAVLAEWSYFIHIEKELPAPAREAGLLSLYLLDLAKDSYQNEDDWKKLLDVIIRVVSAISQEFNDLLEDELFSTHSNERRPLYLHDLITMSLVGIETASLCRHVPDTVTRLAWHEWLIDDQEDAQDEYSHSHIDVDGYFGVHEHRVGINFFPPSGLKGPFHRLLQYHPVKGLDFIIRLLNATAEKYAHSALDVPENYSSLPAYMVPSGVKQVELQLNDGTAVKQYCSERLWLGYRGQSVLPDVLQSALMALENWLVNLAQSSNANSTRILELIYDDILRRSNSVMPTAVLASVAIGFLDKFGGNALPLLRTPEFYDLDLVRSIHEHGEKEMNLFSSGLIRDPFADTYMEERRTAALRPWRKENLEGLIVRLQFSELRGDIYAILDDLRFRVGNDENWRFRFHRIDSRGWHPELDKEHNRIVFTTQDLEPDLAEVQKRTQEEIEIRDRFFTLNLWSEKILKNEPLEHECYTNWTDALEEAKTLLELVGSEVDGAVSDNKILFYGGLVKAAAVFLRDHSTELSEEDQSWCIKLVLLTVCTNADSKTPAAIFDKVDCDGAAASASILPLLLDFAPDNGDKLFVKRVIGLALTHVNVNVQMTAANAIREYLWQRDPDFAQKCFLGAVEYARLISSLRAPYGGFRHNGFAQNESNEHLDKFRERLTCGDVAADIDQITFHSHDPQQLLIPCLMVPNNSTEPMHTSLLSRILTMLTEAERIKNLSRYEKEDEIEIHYEVQAHFERRFAEYLFGILDTSVQQTFLEQLRKGCDTAPSFTNGVLLYIQVSAEQAGRIDRYWWFWDQLSERVQQIAIETAKSKSQNSGNRDKRKLIRYMLYADMPWKRVGCGCENIALGKEPISKFVVNAGINPDVFEAMASLMFHCPTIFFESGLTILSEHQKRIGGTDLLSPNASYYLERSISRFLLSNNTKTLSRAQYMSCQILLDAIVETGSSGAYYLREHLIRSRRIDNGVAYV